MRTLYRLLLVALVPIVLLVGAARLLTLPWFVQWEYSRPGFPPDPLGMAPQERLHLALVCIAFLNQPDSAGLLEGLRFSDGSLVFNERELRHMMDVKAVYDGLTLGALAALAIIIGGGWWLSRRGDGAGVWDGLMHGGLSTLLLLIGLGLWMLIDFSGFFTAFHAVFFEGDTWLFSYTDSLIRLFPLRLWEDAGMLLAGLVGVVALVLALLSRAMQGRMSRALDTEVAVEDGVH